ncbi:hypothetical protein PoB_006425300 [Plakobranchus ocellatus]|uniref:Uncharacterized protein n=1 Tax=Plakobranchus ocellatus TaxID=259542 RepID=A0AAV4D127_9GAST|nr:hypothetical protein PoB_006425300 [Plakobranchus ocellatus]
MLDSSIGEGTRNRVLSVIGIRHSESYPSPRSLTTPHANPATMAHTLYEVAALTPYTDSLGRCGIDNDRITRTLNKRSRPPINALFTEKNLTGFSDVVQNSLDRVSAALDAIYNPGDYSKSGFNVIPTGPLAPDSQNGENPIATNVNEKGISGFVHSFAHNDQENRDGSDTGGTSAIVDVEALRREALERSHAIWASEFAPALDKGVTGYDVDTQLGQPAWTSSYSSDSLGFLTESSISSSSWWGGSSVSSGFMQESSVSEVPLLASTMLEPEQLKFSTQEEIMDAIEKVNSKISTDSSGVTEMMGSSSGKDLTDAVNEFEMLGLSKHMKPSRDAPNYNADFSDNFQCSENISSHFHEANDKEKLHPTIEESLKNVANQLYELDKTSNQKSNNLEPPRTKSYRDVLMSSPLPAKVNIKSHDQVVAAVSCTDNKIQEHPVTSGKKSFISDLAPKAINGQSKEPSLTADALGGNFSLNLNLLHNETEERGEGWRLNDQDKFMLLPSKEHFLDRQTESIYSTQGLGFPPSADGSFVSALESSAEMYQTAPSQMEDSEEDGSDRASEVDSRKDVVMTQEDKRKTEDISGHYKEMFISDDEGGNVADVECSYETNSSSYMSCTDSDEFGRGRKRHRLLKRDIQRLALKGKLSASQGVSQLDKTTSLDSTALTRLRSTSPPGQLGNVDVGFVTISQNLVQSSDLMQLSDDCPSVRSSSAGSDRTSGSRGSSLNSCSSSSSTGKSEARAEPVRKLNPDCAPFIPRSMRHLSLENQGMNQKGVGDANTSFKMNEESLHNNLSVWQKQHESSKDLDSCLMPPPTSTKVPSGVSYLHRRVNQLRLSSSVPGDSGIGIGIDTTSHCSVSANTTQGGGHRSTTQAFDDSGAHSLHRTEPLDVIFGTDQTMDKHTQHDTSAHSSSTVSLKSDCHLNYPIIPQNFKQKNFQPSIGNDKLFGEENTIPSSIHDSNEIPQTSPYSCKLRHADFFSLADVSASQGTQAWQDSILPREFMDSPISHAIVSISQRVVRLRVDKPFASQSSSSSRDRRGLDADKDEPRPDVPQYGTGFVFSITRDVFEVRTHEAVIGSAEEAARAEIAFELIVPKINQTFLVVCESENESLSHNVDVNFSSKAHSQVTSFCRATPSQLVPWLHLFQPVPVKVRNSLFEDSCYFSDASPEDSLIYPTDNGLSQQEDRVLSQSFNICSLNKLTETGSESEVYRENQWKDLWNFEPWQVNRNTTFVSLSANGIGERKETQEGDSTHSNDQAGDLESNSKDDFSWDSMVLQTGNMAAMMAGLTDDVDHNKDRYHAEGSHCKDNGHAPALSNTDVYVCDGLHFTADNGCRNADICNDSDKNSGSFHDNVDYSQFSVAGLTSLPYPVTECHPGQAETLAGQARNESSLAQPLLLHQGETFCGHYEVDTGSDCSRTPGGQTGCGMKRLRRLGEDRRPSSPLVVMERRAEAEGRTTFSGVGQCPYSDADPFGKSGLYTCFSSYAGDEIGAIRDKLLTLGSTGQTRNSTATHNGGSSREYENLLYAQNNCRESYNLQRKESLARNILSDIERTDVDGGEADSDDSVFLPSDKPSSNERKRENEPTPFNITNPGGSECKTECDELEKDKGFGSKVRSNDFRNRSHRADCDGVGVTRCFAPTDPFKDILNWQSYLSTWDTDLLNLNPDLTPRPDYHTVASTLDYVFSEDDPSQKLCCLRSATSGSSADLIGGDTRAIIISHPHGGRKIISSGFFSRHFHVGGNLYDTPTCMGSCGAPVISLAEDGSGLYVTHLVHAGNVNVNGINAGKGVAFFKI